MRSVGRIVLIALALGDVGCREVDPCDGDTSCIPLHVAGSSSVTRIDQLTVNISGALTRQGTTWLAHDGADPPPVDLPVAIAIVLPNRELTGIVKIEVAGFLAGDLVGEGERELYDLAQLGHVHLTLSAPADGGVRDHSSLDGPIDFSTRDLSVIDLRPPPDLAMADLTTRDLSMFDLRQPADLTPPVDLRAPPDFLNLPPPVLESVSPGIGPTSGGITVGIHGQNFAPNATVMFGSHAATSVTWRSTALLEVQLPAPMPWMIGNVDVVVSNPDGPSSSTLRNGFRYVRRTSFQLPTPSYQVGSSDPVGIAVGDFDRSGSSDLAITVGGPFDLSLLTGVGDGRFGAAILTSYGTSSTINPRTIAAADFSGDGWMDLAIAHRGTSTTTGAVYVMHNQKDLSFTANKILTNGSYTWDVVAADINRDGRSDLVAMNSSSTPTVSTILNSGVGIISFEPPKLLTPSGSCSTLTPCRIALGDLSGDSKLDLVVTQPTSNRVTHFGGNGDGTYIAGQSLSAGSGPAGVAIADLDGDGHADVATSNSTADRVTVLWGGASGFSSTSYSVGSTPNALAIADFNDDGLLDLVVANTAAGSVSILEASGLRTFGSAVNFGCGSSPSALAAADFNGDGLVDLAVTNEVTVGTVTVLLNSAR